MTHAPTAKAVRDEAVVLGGFALKQRIGEGGFGTVYLAEQTALGRTAVVKVMRRSLAHRRDAIERFELEARLASRLDHPGAAHIYAFGTESDGTLWIAMEHVKGTTLEALLEAGALSLERGLPMVERLCEAVQTAHEQGVIHRDIKPANVIVAVRGGRLLPKLLDFGIAKQLGATGGDASEAVARALRAAGDLSSRDTAPQRALVDEPRLAGAPVASPGLPEDAGRRAPLVITPELAATQATGDAEPRGAPSTQSLTKAGQVLGSPPYMAPEQWLDASVAGPAADQYALALVAYEVFAGHRAFDGATVSMLAQQHLYEPLPRSPRLPAALFDVIARGAAKAPEERFPDVAAFVLALREASGLAPAADEPIAGLRADLLAAWSSDAPQPIAETIAALATARTPLRAIERASAAGRVLARWLGVLAIACRSRRGRLDEELDAEQLDALRALRRSVPRDEDWLTLAVALARPYAERPEAFPIAELATWCAGSASVAGLRRMVRGEGMVSCVTDDGRALRDQAAWHIAALEHVLEELAWLLDYELGREVADGVELWIGPRTDERIVLPGRRCGAEVEASHPGSDGGAGRVVVLDADGARVVALSPLVAIAPPMAGAGDEVFVFAGPARSGAAALAALPRAFEREDAGVWSWFAEHLLAAGPGERAREDDERSPYPGLSAYTSEDRGSFLGREREVAELVNRLRAQSLVAVVGPSGAGKSSLLAAGVVPALPAGWLVATLRPGRAPLAALATAIDRLDLPGASPYRGAELAGATDLAARMHALAERHATTLVVVVDQVEELFTQSAPEAERHAFAELLAAFASHARGRVVLGVRDDFLCRVDELAPWRGIVGRAVQLVGIPPRAELERIVAEPARRRSYTFEDAALPRAIVDEIADRPGALPLLSFVAAGLWERRDRHFRRITSPAYAELGGVTGALVQHADGVVDRLPAGDRRLVRIAFRRLLTADGARLPLRRDELAAALGTSRGATDERPSGRADAAAGDAGARIVEHLLAARLIVSRDDDDGGERVEIVHEAIATMWPRLAAWRREDASQVRLHEQLAAAARHWDERGRPAELLWRGAALAELRASDDVAATQLERAFAEASEAAARAGRRRRIAIVGGAFAALATGLVVLALLNHRISMQRAEAQTRVVSSLEERARAALAAGQAGQALVYLAEAQRLGAEGPAHELITARVTSAIEAAHGAVADAAPIWVTRFGARGVATAGPEGARLRTLDGASVTAVAGAIRAAFVDGEPAGIATLSARGEVALSAPGRRWSAASTAVERVEVPVGIEAGPAIIATYGGSEVQVWSVADGALQATLAHAGTVQAVAIAGDRVATVDAGGAIAAWTADGARLGGCTSPASPARAIGVLPGGRIASGGADGILRLCTPAREPMPALVVAAHRAMVLSLDARADGRALATAGHDGLVHVFDAATGLPAATLAGHAGPVWVVRYSPDGTRLATGGDDRTVRIWDAASGAQLAALQGHAARLTGLAWLSADELATTSYDGTLRRWNVARAVRDRVAVGEGTTVAAFASDGLRVVTVGSDGAARVWDARTAELVATIRHASAIASAELVASQRPAPASAELVASQRPAPASAELVASQHPAPASAELVASQRPAPANAELAVQRPAPASAELAVQRPAQASAELADADIATLHADGQVRTWSARGALLRELASGHREPTAIAAAPGGRTLVTAGDGSLHVWRDGSRIATVEVGIPVDRIVFDRGATRLAASTLEVPEVVVVDLAPARVVARLAVDGPVSDVALDGDLVAIAARRAVVFDVATRAMTPLAHPDAAQSLALAVHLLADGRIVTAEDSSVTVWDRSGAAIRRLPMAVRPYDLASDAGDHLLAIGTGDGAVELWELAGYRRQLRLHGHRRAVQDVRFAADGTRVLTAGDDGRVAAWDVGRRAAATEDLATLARCRVPFELVGDALQPRSLDLDDPTCR